MIETAPPNGQKKYLKVKDVAELLGKSEGGIYNWVSQKRIPHFHVGGSVRFDREDLEKWVEQQKVSVRG